MPTPETQTDTTATSSSGATSSSSSTKAVKPGYKTTEGIMTAIASVIGILYVLGVIAPDGTSPVAHAIALAAVALTNAGYAVSRGIAKH